MQIIETLKKVEVSLTSGDIEELIIKMAKDVVFEEHGEGFGVTKINWNVTGLPCCTVELTRVPV